MAVSYFHRYCLRFPCLFEILSIFRILSLAIFLVVQEFIILFLKRWLVTPLILSWKKKLVTQRLWLVMELERNVNKWQENGNDFNSPSFLRHLPVLSATWRSQLESWAHLKWSSLPYILRAFYEHDDSLCYIYYIEKVTWNAGRRWQARIWFSLRDVRQLTRRSAKAKPIIRLIWSILELDNLMFVSTLFGIPSCLLITRVPLTLIDLSSTEYRKSVNFPLEIII